MLEKENAMRGVGDEERKNRYRCGRGGNGARLRKTQSTALGGT
jgi:hypothetical protein